MAEEEFVWAVKGEGHLISNKPGASARKHADALRTEQPVVTRLARLLGEHNDERAYRLGAVAEEEVGRRLSKLDDRWVAINDIVRNAKGTNIDHLVIGPAGVFSLNTKNHPDAKIVVTDKSLRINGRAANYLHVARHEATKVSETLTRAVGYAVEVTPVIVVMNAYMDVKAEPPDIRVITRKQVPAWFKGLSPALPAHQVLELQIAAGRPSTWRSQLALKRWQRGGKKRTYVNDKDGRTLGYRDDITGEIHANDPSDLDRLSAALTSSS